MATFTFQCIIDCWSTCLDAGMPGAILSCEVVATCGFSSHNCVTKKVNKQVEGKIKNFMLDWDQRTKKQGNKGTAKSCETREVPIPANILVDI